MNTETTRAAIIASFESNSAAIVADLVAIPNNELLKFVVTVSKLPMSFSTAADGTPHAVWCPVREATRYATASEARSMAAKVVNGLGERGEVSTLAGALIDALKDIQQAITDLKAHA